MIFALLGPPALAAWSRTLHGSSPSLRVEILLQLAFCSIAILVLLIVLRWERLPLASIGVRRPDLMTGALALIITLVTYYLLPLVTAPVLRTVGVGGFEAGLQAIRSQPRWWRICVALTSGPVEELLYRGYAVERLGTITGRLPLGGLLAAMAFGLAHLPFWGLGPALAANLPFGILLVAAYIWRRDVFATTIAHTGLLLIGLLAV
jgi:membrane protease YdiL (CAAX protease family)